MPTVRVLRPFAHGHHDRIVRAGELIEVDPDRARDLAGNDLVEKVTAQPRTEVTPPPETKPEADPANKARPAPITKPGRKPMRRNVGSR